MNKEELEYEHYCNEQLRNKITNLEYKIKRLEEDNKYKIVLDKIKEFIKEEYEEYEKGKENYKQIGIEDYVKGQVVACEHIEKLLGKE